MLKQVSRLTGEVGYHGAGILFYHRDKNTTRVLLGKRAIEPSLGAWSLPGGKRDTRDMKSYLKCAIRETFEEFNEHNSIRKILTEAEIREVMNQRSEGLRLYLPPFFFWQTFVIEVPSPPSLKEWPRHNYEFSAVAWHDTKALPPRTHFGVRYALARSGL